MTQTSPSFELPGGTVYFIGSTGILCSHAVVGTFVTCTGRAVSGVVHVSYRPGKDYFAPMSPATAVRH